MVKMIHMGHMDIIGYHMDISGMPFERLSATTEVGREAGDGSGVGMPRWARWGDGCHHYMGMFYG